MTKLIVVESHNGGRLANQLWNFISIYSYTLEKNYLLVNPTFAEYAELFEQFRGNALLSPNLNWKFLPKSSARRLLRLIQVLNRRLPIAQSFQTGEDSNAIILAPTDPDFQISKPIGLFNGWLFRNKLGLEKHGDKVRHAFRPAKEYAEQIEKIWHGLKPNTYKIGIHIRRTDYKDHLEGKYYFELDRYRAEMKKIEKLHRDKKITFLVFSDEPRGKKEFKEFKSSEVYISNNPAIVDLFLLSKCDELVGPPSTFSQFASWYGKNRLNVVE